MEKLYIVTGAAGHLGSTIVRLLAEGGQEALAGRVALLQFSPLSCGEIVADSGTPPFRVDLSSLRQRQSTRPALDTPAIFQRIFTGGMPALASGQYANPNIFCSSYISTCSDRDVGRLSTGMDDLKFLGSLRAAAARTGQQVNCKGIADDAEIDQATARNWIRILSVPTPTTC